MLGARKAVQQGMIALEMSLRGLLRNFGLKVGAISRGRFEARIRELATGNPMLVAATEPLLRARAALRQELAGLERRVRQLAQDDPVCHRLMSMPGIGAVVALTFRSAVDDPARFTSSKKVGPWVGLTPSRNQSGERDVSGGITKASDVNLRRAIAAELPQQAPSFFFIDIQPDQLPGLLDRLNGDPGVSQVDTAPSLRGIITAINDIPARDWGDHWVLRGDRGVSHAAAPPEGAASDVGGAAG